MSNHGKRLWHQNGKIGVQIVHTIVPYLQVTNIKGPIPMRTAPIQIERELPVSGGRRAGDLRQHL